MEIVKVRRTMPWVMVAASLMATSVWVAQGSRAKGRDPSEPATPADGYNVHVTAPHVVDGKVMGPFHHYCRVLSPEPIIECLCYRSSGPGARLEQVEHILSKSITRTGAVSLTDWNKNWHDHKQEIATGRVQVLDLPPDKAKEVADLVATTDGIILHLWSEGDKVPSGRVMVAQSVGHVNLTQAELAKGVQEAAAAKASSK
jgi:Protein of unknown function (DUF1264)